jgi:hypothetical protein
LGRGRLPERVGLSGYSQRSYFRLLTSFLCTLISYLAYLDPDHLTGICRIPSTSGSPLDPAPGDENPSRPFKLSPEHPPLGMRGVLDSLPAGHQETGLPPQEIALCGHNSPCWYYVHYNMAYSAKSACAGVIPAGVGAEVRGRPKRKSLGGIHESYRGFQRRKMTITGTVEARRALLQPSELHRETPILSQR